VETARIQVILYSLGGNVLGLVQQGIELCQEQVGEAGTLD